MRYLLNGKPNVLNSEDRASIPLPYNNIVLSQSFVTSTNPQFGTIRSRATYTQNDWGFGADFYTSNALIYIDSLEPFYAQQIFPTGQGQTSGIAINIYELLQGTTPVTDFENSFRTGIKSVFSDKPLERHHELGSYLEAFIRYGMAYTGIRINGTLGILSASYPLTKIQSTSTLEAIVSFRSTFTGFANVSVPELRISIIGFVMGAS